MIASIIKPNKNVHWIKHFRHIYLSYDVEPCKIVKIRPVYKYKMAVLWGSTF